MNNIFVFLTFLSFYDNKTEIKAADYIGIILELQ